MTFQGIALKPETIDIVQNKGEVTATINETSDGFASGTGSVANPRTLSVSVTFAAAQPAPYALTYVGTLNDSLLDLERNGHRVHRLSVRLHGDPAIDRRLTVTAAATGPR